MVAMTQTLNRIVFHNPKNGYIVAKTTDDISIVGNMVSPKVGCTYELEGEWIEHPKFGKQLKVDKADAVLPDNKDGAIRYLADTFYGIGPMKARRIVEAIGEGALEKVKANPALLDQFDYLTDGMKQEITDDLHRNDTQAALSAMIRGPGIGAGTVAKIMRQYGNDSVNVIKDNPYVLSSDVFGVGFKLCDKIALTTGIKPNSPFRVEAAVDYVLKEAGGEGHVYLEPRNIVGKLLGMKDRFGKRQSGLLEGSGVQAVPDIRDANVRLISNGKCVRDGDAVYSRELYDAELIVAGCVRCLISQEVPAIEDEAIDALIVVIEKRDKIEHAAQQKEAVKLSLKNPLSVITGGPGVGKTRTLLTICDAYSYLFPMNEIYLAAPTGRAAKRMSEATGREAKTIHRLLQYVPGEGFFYGARFPLPGPGLLILDESSMIDIELAASLFAAVGSKDNGLQVVLVGDTDQLPSVGPGSVLRDVIASGLVPTVRLEFNYRQAGGSKVAEYANLICQGIVPPLESAGDFEFAGVEDAEEARDKVLALVKELVDEGRGLLEYQVLAPMRRGSCGVKELNEAIREIANPAVANNGENKKSLGSYRLGDKVMVIKNDYSLGVFNGDIGLVTEIMGGKMAIDFGDQVVEFAVEHLELLTLSYASTIHKSQGSEYGTVIMPLVRQHYMMLQRNLAYTGMTRAKERLVLVADEWAVKKAVGNAVIEHRFSKLAQRIRGE